MKYRVKLFNGLSDELKLFLVYFKKIPKDNMIKDYRVT